MHKPARLLLGCARALLQEQAAALYRMNMQQYGALKAQLIGATAVLVGLGSALAYAAGGRDLALPFALGGTSGMLYQYLLQARAGRGFSAFVWWRFGWERFAAVAQRLAWGRSLQPGA